MTGMDLDKMCWRYMRQSLIWIVSLSLVALLAMRIWMINEILIPLIVSVTFALVVEASDICVWRKVAKNAPDSLPTFFMAVSGFRMLAGIGVLFVYYLLANGHSIKVPFIIFMVFYFMILIHHSLFFSVKSKSEK